MVGLTKILQIKWTVITELAANLLEVDVYYYFTDVHTAQLIISDL